MTILQAGKNLTEALNQVYDKREATNISDVVLEKITGFSKTQRLIDKQSVLTLTQQQQLKDFTNRLLQHEPVQYILNEAWFGGLKFYVDENVLIPRPETEELVETVLADINALPHSDLSVLDIGTGSGCIAITLKKKLPKLTVYGLDINEKALNIVRKNAIENNVKIELIHADMLQLSNNTIFSQFDIIVSNPPYVKQSEMKDMRHNVLQYEPHGALFVPDEDALIFYNAIADFSLQYLNRENGKLYFEINETLGKEVTGLLEARRFSEIRVKKDLQQKDRIVSALLK